MKRNINDRIPLVEKQSVIYNKLMQAGFSKVFLQNAFIITNEYVFTYGENAPPSKKFLRLWIYLNKNLNYGIGNYEKLMKLRHILVDASIFDLHWLVDTNGFLILSSSTYNSKEFTKKLQTNLINNLHYNGSVVKEYVLRYLNETITLEETVLFLQAELSI